MNVARCSFFEFVRLSDYEDCGTGDRVGRPDEFDWTYAHDEGAFRAGVAGQDFVVFSSVKVER